jgi:peroxiredoxin
MKPSRIWMLLALLLACMSLPVLGGESAPAKPKVKVGDKAPDFSLRDLDSNLVRLSDMAYAGKEVSWKKKKKVLIDFFRTDCKPCIKELPQVLKCHQKMGDQVQVLMVALLESEKGREKLDAFLKKHKIPFPVLVDAYETAAKKYIVDGETLTLPSIFLIDENGVVRARYVGLKEDLHASLLETVGKKTPPSR